MSELLDEAQWAARYELLHILGRGASATVYRARRRSDGVEVAIKELLLAWTAEADAIARDTEAFASLRCEGVPHVIERARVRSRGLEVVYLVMEHIEGVPLDRETRDKRYRSDEVFLLLAELLDILARLHAHGIVHRDVKPENIVRRSDGTLALLDLGSAVIARSAPADARFTSSGTLGFAPPEQLAGVARPGNDLYAAGALAVALLTREHPAKLLDAHLRLDWRSHVALPCAQAQLLDALLAPADVRPQDAAQMAARAREAAHARPTPPRRGLFVGALASALALVTLGVWAASSSASPATEAPFASPPAPPTSRLAPPAPPPPSEPIAEAWRCGSQSDAFLLERLAPGSSRCAARDGCRSLSAGFEGLDLDALCAAEPPPTSPVPSVVVSSEHRFRTEIRGEPVVCTRHTHISHGCTVTCVHPVETSATHEALAARFEAYVTGVRDTYGAEQSGSIQGLASYPRRQHRWHAGGDTLELELDGPLCCAPGDRSCGITQMRTRYARSLRPGA